MITSFKTILVIVENSQNDIDHLILKIMELLLQQLSYFAKRKQKKQKVISMLIQVLSVCFFYDAAKVMDYVTQESQRTDMLFKSWLTLLQDEAFTKDFETKRIILGLASLLQLNKLPGLIQNNFPAIIISLSQLVVKAYNRKLIAT